MAGEFTEVGSIQVYRNVVDKVNRLASMDPKMAFRSATPGVIGQLVQNMGKWEGIGDERWEIPGVTEGVRAIGRDQRMLLGKSKIAHIVARPGFEIAGFSQTIHPEDFAYGLSREAARDLALRPNLDFNAGVASILLDLITAGDKTGSITDNFAWSALDLDDNVASQPLATQSAQQVANVFANGSQSFTGWPMRDGTQAAAGHDHLSDTGAVWSAANAKVQANNILEHPTNGRVRAFVGSTVASAVFAAKRTDYQYAPQRELIEGGVNKGDDFAGATRIGDYDNVDYWHMVDLPASGVLMHAVGKQPFHVHIGALAVPGMDRDKGAWTRNHAENDEVMGMTHGYRRFLSAGVQDPLSVTYYEHAA